MPLVLGGQSATAGGYSIGNSCMFNVGDSSVLTKTPAGDGNKKIFTYSFWVKRSALGYVATTVNAMATASTAGLSFYQDDGMKFYIDSGNGQTTDAAFRDPSAWYHIVQAVDTTDGVAADRIKTYVNGVQLTSFSHKTNPSVDTEGRFNSSSYAMTISAAGDSFGGYMADVCFIDGTQYAASDFGQFNEDSPSIWEPIDISGLTFGTNGFWLDFADSAALGNDVSGQNNDYAVTNLDATNQKTDTPTNNFATINPLVSYYSSSTITEGNLKVAWNSDGGAQMIGNMGLTAGKWYWEWYMTDMVEDYLRMGITDAVPSADPNYLGAYTNDNYCNGSYGNYSYQGSWYNNDSETSYGTAWQSAAADGKVMSQALDLDNNKIYIALDGAWMNSADPGAGTGGFSITAVSSLSGGQYFPAMSTSSSNAYITETNFGNPSFTVVSTNADENGYGSFEHAVPSGFLAICTKNLGSDGG